MDNTSSVHEMPLTAIAKAITRFLFRQAGLPTSLSSYGGFFAGFFTAAVGASALYAYIERHQFDPSKIQLAVYHIIRLFEHRPDYWRLSANPRALLAQMEPEVMRMVDLHISKAEAGKVVEELKRKFDCEEFEERARKRIAARHPEERLLTPAPMPGTFPAADPATPKKKKPSTPSPIFRRSPAPSPELAPRPQHTPKGRSYGLEYNDRDLYSSPLSSSSSSSRDSSPSPPTTGTADGTAAATEATKPALKEGTGSWPNWGDSKCSIYTQEGDSEYAEAIRRQQNAAPSQPRSWNLPKEALGRDRTTPERAVKTSKVGQEVEFSVTCSTGQQHFLPSFAAWGDYGLS
ncbi:hypothetical protein G6514_010013 [Epicoccum nigrum]|nr:hypothetical protein G6514_010013 [Epicoccum nigrum]